MPKKKNKNNPRNGHAFPQTHTHQKEWLITSGWDGETFFTTKPSSICPGVTMWYLYRTLACLMDAACRFSAVIVHDPNIQLQKLALREQYTQNANTANAAWPHLHHANRHRLSPSLTHTLSRKKFSFTLHFLVRYQRRPEQHQHVEQLTVFVLPKKLQLLLLLSAQGVDDGDG